MPEVTFRIRWPDGTEESCYSPSTIIQEYLSPRQDYALAEFLERSLKGLDHAARRVEEKFGYRCSSADAQAQTITRRAAQYGKEETVQCLSMN